MPLVASPLHCPLRETELNAALRSWAKLNPEGGVLALVPAAEQAQVGLLQQVCRQLRLPLAGAVFPALVTEAGERRDGVMLVRLTQMPPVRLFTAMDMPEAADQVVTQVAAWLDALPPGGGEPVLFSIFDACLGNLYALLRQLGRGLDDRVVYAGANAGQETFQPLDCVFDGDILAGNALLTVLLPSTSRPSVEHGFSLPVRIMRATRTEANRILTLDDRPAFDVYREALVEGYGQELSVDSFYEHSVHFPLAILAGESLVQVRIPVVLDAAGGLTCVGEVPEGSIIVVIKAPEVGESDCIDRIADHLGVSQGTLLTFYCAGRRLHLGPDGTRRELADLCRQTGSAHLAGALSLGEISTDGRGEPAFHNAAMLCLRVRDQDQS